MQNIPQSLLVPNYEFQNTNSKIGSDVPGECILEILRQEIKNMLK
jgi:hypothetical protein